MDKMPIFISHNHFLEWLKKSDNNSIQKFFLQWFLERQKEKKLVYSMCQIELRSLKMPGINYLNNLFGSYYETCKKLNFINKYENFSGWNNQIELNKRRKVFIDTREQHPLNFINVSTEVKCLKYGDYAFSDKDWTGKLVIERKSLSDFIGTMFSGYDRFTREIERARKDNAYLIILVEENLSKALEYKKNNLVHYKIRIPPAVIFHNVRKLIQQYDNIQFLFSDSHSQSGKLVEKIFSLGKDVKKFDLQLLKDTKII